jgi:hypothetical protein
MTSLALSGVNFGIINFLDFDAGNLRNLKTKLQGDNEIAFDGVSQIVARFLKIFALVKKARNVRHRGDNDPILVFLIFR